METPKEILRQLKAKTAPGIVVFNKNTMTVDDDLAVITARNIERIIDEAQAAEREKIAETHMDLSGLSEKDMDTVAAFAHAREHGMELIEFEYDTGKWRSSQAEGLLVVPGFNYRIKPEPANSPEITSKVAEQCGERTEDWVVCHLPSGHEGFHEGSVQFGVRKWPQVEPEPQYRPLPPEKFANLLLSYNTSKSFMPVQNIETDTGKVWWDDQPCTPEQLMERTIELTTGKPPRDEVGV